MHEHGVTTEAHVCATVQIIHTHVRFAAAYEYSMVLDMKMTRNVRGICDMNTHTHKKRNHYQNAILMALLYE